MPIGYGEKANGRKAMADLKKRLRKEGFSQEYADKKSRESARRIDRGAQPPPKPRTNNR